MATDHNNKKKILCFQIWDHGRDMGMLTPVLYYATNFLNCSFEFAFVWDIDAIRRKKPDLVLIPNSIGSLELHEIAKYAYESQIPLFATISEGNFPTQDSFNPWGHNKEKKLYESHICLWSQRTLDYLKKRLPDLSDKMVLTGGLGFDRYKFLEHTEKKDFFKKKGLKQHQKVVGYAGWAFGMLSNKVGITNLTKYFEGTTQDLEWIRSQMLQVEEILRQAIINNPDTFFILKRHPTEVPPHLSMDYQNEMVRLKDHENVLYITENEEIHDLISVCDMWLSFESTSALEAWVMGKTTTIFINPEVDFKRTQVYKGTVIANSYKTLQSYIDEFYETGAITDFFDPIKLTARRKIIEETIGFDDGLNHLRTGYYLEQSLLKESPSSPPPFKIKYVLRWLFLSVFSVFYNRKLFLMVPKLKKTAWIFDRWKLENTDNFVHVFFNDLDKFYTKNNLFERIKSGNIWQEIIPELHTLKKPK